MISRQRKVALAICCGTAMSNLALLPMSHSEALGNRHVLVARGASHVGLPDFADLVERAGPAVVNVSVTGAVTSAPDAAPESVSADGAVAGTFHESAFFRYFAASTMQPVAPPLFGQGSGFIVRPDGVILTSAHVLQNAARVTVRLNDRREFNATVLGSDPRTDIAVLKIAAQGLPTAALGTAATLRVGQWVIAIGSPFGFENTVTSGIVSAKARSLSNDSVVPFIQTDVPLNPGNSGGPLIDLDGRVIGINAQIFSHTGGYQGIGFAIPIDIAMQVEREILSDAKHVAQAAAVVSDEPALVRVVDRASADRDAPFGLAVRPLTAQECRLSGLLNGLVVQGVNGAAARAGLQLGDVVLAINGEPLHDEEELRALVTSAWKPGIGKPVALLIRRGVAQLYVPLQAG